MAVKSWQYNGVDKFSTILAWCVAHLGDDWDTNLFDTINFRTDAAHTMFILRWGGNG